MSLSSIFRKTFVTAAMVLSAVSHATIIESATNNPLNFSWTSLGGGYTMYGDGTMAVSGFNSSSLTIVVTLNNDTNTLLVDNTDVTGNDARLAVFGFGINPNATAVSFVDDSDDGMIGAALGDIPSLSLIEVCAYGQNCSSGANSGINGNGGTDTFTLVLTGTWGDSVNIEPIGFKYQTANGSFEFTSTATSSSTSSTSSTSSNGGGPSEVPEPGSMSLVLLGLGLLGASLWSRRRSMQS